MRGRGEKRGEKVCLHVEDHDGSHVSGSARGVERGIVGLEASAWSDRHVHL